MERPRKHHKQSKLEVQVRAHVCTPAVGWGHGRTLIAVAIQCIWLVGGWVGSAGGARSAVNCTMHARPPNPRPPSATRWQPRAQATSKRNKRCEGAHATYQDHDVRSGTHCALTDGHTSPTGSFLALFALFARPFFPFLLAHPVLPALLVLQSLQSPRHWCRLVVVAWHTRWQRKRTATSGEPTLPTLKHTSELLTATEGKL